MPINPIRLTKLVNLVPKPTRRRLRRSRSRIPMTSEVRIRGSKTLRHSPFLPPTKPSTCNHVSSRKSSAASMLPSSIAPTASLLPTSSLCRALLSVPSHGPPPAPLPSSALVPAPPPPSSSSTTPPASSTTYLRTYHAGDYVAIKVNNVVHKGMPHKFYHGRTGRTWNAIKRAVGVKVNKQVGTNGKVLISGVTTTGENIVSQYSQVFEMQTHNLCPSGQFSISFQLPGPVDPHQFSGNFGTDGILEGIVMKGKYFMEAVEAKS
ncbi:hypothetical protein JHK86_009629 [Glycine max]|nr:hypothetical protein JHK86_009629 [Glycine max]